eukprot:GHVR01054734.1.p1 GENE.GHVR01054734.1~~GHVR01054734.1.p1  ORF type:complete len:269 (+),score=78.81 GHVR01054734.1:73-807(+)
MENTNKSSTDNTVNIKPSDKTKSNEECNKEINKESNQQCNTTETKQPVSSPVRKRRVFSDHCDDQYQQHDITTTSYQRNDDYKRDITYQRNINNNDNSNNNNNTSPVRHNDYGKRQRELCLKEIGTPSIGTHSIGTHSIGTHSIGTSSNWDRDPNKTTSLNVSQVKKTHDKEKKTQDKEKKTQDKEKKVSSSSKSRKIDASCEAAVVDDLEDITKKKRQEEFLSAMDLFESTDNHFGIGGGRVK